MVKEDVLDVGVTASGWVDLKMPWESMGGRSIIDMQAAWQAGTYPASVHMQMYGMVVEEPYTPIGSAWIMQISRFTYAFDSSVTGNGGSHDWRSRGNKSSGIQSYCHCIPLRSWGPRTLDLPLQFHPCTRHQTHRLGAANYRWK